MTAAQIVPTLVIPLVLWRVYRRVRRNIGRQPWRPARLRGAVIFFSILTALIAVAASRSPNGLAALGAGLLLSVPLGLFGLRLTRFDLANEEKFYTPNTTLGLAITLLFVGRIVYRIVTLLGANTAAGAPPMFQSALTLLVFGVTAGYYITYYLGVLLRGQEMAPAPAA